MIRVAKIHDNSVTRNLSILPATCHSRTGERGWKDSPPVVFLRARKKSCLVCPKVRLGNTEGQACGKPGDRITYKKGLLVLLGVTKSGQLQGLSGCRTSADVHVIVSGKNRGQDVCLRIDPDGLGLRPD